MSASDANDYAAVTAYLFSLKARGVKFGIDRMRPFAVALGHPERAVPCIHIAEWESYRAHSTAAGISVSTRAPGTGAVDHIAFNAGDCEAVKAKLRAYDVPFAENSVPSAGLTQLFLHDPNGVKVEINVRDLPVP